MKSHDEGAYEVVINGVRHRVSRRRIAELAGELSVSGEDLVDALTRAFRAQPNVEPNAEEIIDAEELR